MTDTDTGRRVTEEHEPVLGNGQVLWCYVQKWGKLAIVIAASGAAGGWIRSCIVTGADVIGLQTTEAAAAQQEINDETHEELQTAVGEIKIQSQQTADNTGKIVKGMPAPWKRRAGIQ